jgi:ParB family chromosome partitioning protein
MTRNALGKGLSALIREPEASPPAPGHKLSVQAPTNGQALDKLPTDLIDPSPYQPRTRFHEQALEELASSIRSSGVIQPVVVRQTGNRYQLIAGERRWRAAQRAGLLEVPAVVKQVSDELAMEMTLVENLQREDLNPIEQACAFERMVSEFRLTQEQVAERTGKDRATVANALRLLKLDKGIQDMIEEGKISAGHGRALLAIADPKMRQVLAKRSARGAISVRQLERFAVPRGNRKRTAASAPEDPNVRAAMEDLQRALGTKVFLRPKSGPRPGLLLLEYYDDRHLVSLYDLLMGKARAGGAQIE